VLSFPTDLRRHRRDAVEFADGPERLLEGYPIETNLASLLTRVRTGLIRHRVPILAVAGLLLVSIVAFLYWSQQQAKKYDEAFRKGMKLWNQGEPGRALEELRKAAQTDPRDPELWVTIGRAESASNHADRALEAWEEALRREPGFKPALFERGKEALSRHVARRIPPPVDGSTGWLPLGLEPVERLEGAAEEIRRIRADLKEVEYVRELAPFAKGASDLLEGRYRSAEASLRAYADLNRWDGGALAILGIARLYGATPGAAERALSDALALREEKLWLRVRAEARYVQGNYEGAKADFAEAGSEKETEPLFARRFPSAGLILWLRADTGLELTGSSVSRWSDQSGGRHDAVPKDPAAGPRVTASAVHGRPAVLFSGKEDELRLPEGFEDFSAGLSVFLVGEPPPPPSDPWSFVYLATASGGALPIELLLGRRRESESLVYSVEDIKIKPVPFVKGKVSLKGFDGFGAVHEPSGAVRVFQRGVLLDTGTLTVPSRVLRTRNRLGLGCKGHLAEILLYNRSLSDLERLGVEAYLQDRYFSDGGAVVPATEKR
jgi:tetratricopeptide (TPR) repeat protein